MNRGERSKGVIQRENVRGGKRGGNPYLRGKGDGFRKGMTHLSLLVIEGTLQLSQEVLGPVRSRTIKKSIGS